MEPDLHPEEQTLSKFENLHKVTPFSKYLAMALFVASPFIGGWIGYTFAPEKIVEVEKIIEVQKVLDKPGIKEIQSTGDDTQRWSTRELANYYATTTGLSFNYPKVWGPVVEVQNEGSEGIYSYYFSGIDSTSYFLSVEPLDGIDNYQEGAVSWINRVKVTSESIIERCDASQATYSFANETCSKIVNPNDVEFYDFYGYFFSYGDPGPHDSDHTHNFITKDENYWVILTPQKIYTENYWNEKVFSSTVVDSFEFVE